MNKKILGYATILLGGIMLAGCGNSGSTSSASSSSSSTTQSSTQKKSSSTKQSSSSLEQSASSSSNSSAKASSTAKTTKVDDKTAGVMLMLLVEPDYLKQYIGNDYFCYSPAGENPISDATADYSYLTANGDPTSFLYYKVDGNTVTYTLAMKAPFLMDILKPRPFRYRLLKTTITSPKVKKTRLTVMSAN